MQRNKYRYVICLLLAIICLGLLSSCKYMVYEIEFGEYSSYTNFELYKDDFEKIKAVVEATGDYKYCLAPSQIFYVNESGEYVTLELSVDERTSLYNIIDNSVENRLSYVKFYENDVLFDYGIAGCGVVYTNDIENFIDNYNQEKNREFRYKCISEDWYAVYR